MPGKRVISIYVMGPKMTSERRYVIRVRPREGPGHGVLTYRGEATERRLMVLGIAATKSVMLDKNVRVRPALTGLVGWTWERTVPRPAGWGGAAEKLVSFKWFDFYVGWYYNRDKRVLYICPLPTVCIRIPL